MNYRHSTYLSYAMALNGAGFRMAGNLIGGGNSLNIRHLRITGVTILHWVAMLFCMHTNKLRA